MPDLKQDTLYYSDTIPDRWIYQDLTGLLWMFPAAPAAPEALEQRTRYRGYTHALKPARPASLARIYFGSGSAESFPARRPVGACPACGRTYKLTRAGVITTHGPRSSRCPGSGQPRRPLTVKGPYVWAIDETRTVFSSMGFTLLDGEGLAQVQVKGNLIKSCRLTRERVAAVCCRGDLDLATYAVLGRFAEGGEITQHEESLGKAYQPTKGRDQAHVFTVTNTEGHAVEIAARAAVLFYLRGK